jgi:hypothetical protein
MYGGPECPPGASAMYGGPECPRSFGHVGADPCVRPEATGRRGDRPWDGWVWQRCLSHPVKSA